MSQRRAKISKTFRPYNFISCSPYRNPFWELGGVDSFLWKLFLNQKFPALDHDHHMQTQAHLPDGWTQGKLL